MIFDPICFGLGMVAGFGIYLIVELATSRG